MSSKAPSAEIFTCFSFLIVWDRDGRGLDAAQAENAAAPACLDVQEAADPDVAAPVEVAAAAAGDAAEAADASSNFRVDTMAGPSSNGPNSHRC